MNDKVRPDKKEDSPQHWTSIDLVYRQYDKLRHNEELQN